MPLDRGILLVSDATPSGNIASDPSKADWLWFQPSTGTWHTHNTSTGQWDEVARGSPDGVSGRFNNPTRLDIVNGIVVGVEVE